MEAEVGSGITERTRVRLTPRLLAGAEAGADRPAALAVLWKCHRLATALGRAIQLCLHSQVHPRSEPPHDAVLRASWEPACILASVTGLR